MLLVVTAEIVIVGSSFVPPVKVLADSLLNDSADLAASITFFTIEIHISKICSVEETKPFASECVCLSEDMFLFAKNDCVVVAICGVRCVSHDFVCVIFDF